MKKTFYGQNSVWLTLVLMLPFLDIALFSMIVRSIRDNEPERGLFFLFYLQFVPQEIFLRRLFGKKKDRGWFYWASWICRWALICKAVLSVLHVIQGGSWETLMLPHVYNSALWTDHAMIPLGWIACITGTVLMLGRKETRKKTLLFSGIAMPALFFVFGIISPALKADQGLRDFGSNVLMLTIPYAYALGGALFDPLYRNRIREAKEAEKQAKAAAHKEAKAGIVPQPARKQPAPVRPPSHQMKKVPQEKPADLKTIGQKLEEQKKAYERRISRKWNGRELTAPEEKPGDLFEKTALRLFSEGEAAATLGGQRQLVYWMIRAVPRLGRLLREPVGAVFFDPALREDPEEFQPRLEALLKEAAFLLESEKAEKNVWQGMDPETLCAGWYALNRFAADKDGPFDREAEKLKAFFRKESVCLSWLNEMNQK